MILGEVRCGFFQEEVLHPQFAILALKFGEPGALVHSSRRIFFTVLTPAGVHPVPESLL